MPLLVRANSDKPHRCPRCHSIPDAARRHGQARWWRTYSCAGCEVRWWRGWSQLWPGAR